MADEIILGTYERYGIVACIIVSLIMLVCWMAYRDFKNWNKSNKEFQNGMKESISYVNNSLTSLSTTVNIQNARISNMEQSIDSKIKESMDKSFKLNKTNSIKKHNDSMVQRMNMSEKMQSIINELKATCHAKRCGILEFHNGKGNINELGFLFYDLTYESAQKNSQPLLGTSYSKDNQYSIVSPVVQDIIENNGVAIYDGERINSLVDRSSVLYDIIVNKSKSTYMIYFGLYTTNKSRTKMTGILFLEFDRLYSYNSELVKIDDIKEQVGKISQMLELFNEDDEDEDGIL